jgi:2-polyprenyl-6-methoxyphenol hydroxylase-like FAD-dependent oxidoreductase
MRVAILGGGPAGLYFAALWKSRHPADAVQVFEQNAADATFGFGVVFSDRALEFLREDDPETADLIAPQMQTWHDLTIMHRGRSVPIDGIGFSAIGRLELLALLQLRASAAGAELTYEVALTSLDDLADADLIIGADGVNSLARRSLEAEFGASTSYLGNRFAWYGTPRSFETLTQTFIAN